MRLSVFSPATERCGIADYSRYLLAALPAGLDIKLVAAEMPGAPHDYRNAGTRLNEADVVHVHYEHGFFIGSGTLEDNIRELFAALDKPVVVTFHCLPFLENPWWNEYLAQPRVSAIVHSLAHYRALVPIMGEQRLYRHPVPADGAVRAEPTAGGARQYGTAGKQVLTIYGFTKRHKGYDLAVEALRRLPERVVLLVAGGPQNEQDARYLSELDCQIRAHGLSNRVVRTGYLPADDVPGVIRASTIVLAPFTSMTGSASIATALVHGRVVLASDLPTNAEMKVRFGCLHLFRNGDAEDLAQQIRRLLEDGRLRSRLESNTRRFRTECNFATLADLVQRVCQRARNHCRESSNNG